LRELLPRLGLLAILANVGNPAAVLDMREVQAAARMLSLEVATFEPRSCRPPAVGCACGNRLYGPVGGLIAPGAYMKRHELSRCSAVPPTMCHLR